MTSVAAEQFHREQRDPAECKCSLRIRLVGDGCPVCNPEYWKELADEPTPGNEDLDEEQETA